MQRMNVRKVAVVLAVACAGSVGWGQVVYSDGQTHVVPGDVEFSNGQSVMLLNGSKIVLNAGASVNGSPSTNGVGVVGGGSGSRIEVAGGSVTGGAVSLTGTTSSSLTATGGVAVQQTFGDVLVGTSGIITGGSATAYGGAVPVSGLVSATGGSGVNLITGGVGMLSGVTVTGGVGEAENSALVMPISASILGTGGAAVTVQNAGIATITSGTYTGGEGRATNNFVNNAGVSAEGGAALRVTTGGTLTVSGGTFIGGTALALVNLSTGAATATGGGALRLQRSGSVTISGGEFSVGSTGTGTIPPTVAVSRPRSVVEVSPGNATESVQLTITGGTFTGRYVIETLGAGGSPGTSRIDIYGGDLEASIRELTLSSLNITTTIYGSGFLVNGVAAGFGQVVPLSGTISGVLADGGAFEWDYLRSAGVPLVLAAVPEPGVGMVAVGLVGVGLRRRRR